ncbi:acyltransferase family protein [Virgibacillus soli]|uniref:acyltransferase family protein n=1 Tax=Paracerasibacillus soli TaxID=480284 RepID=UPI0035EE18BE
MKRNAYFDNAKFILIYLVVFGHMLQPFVQDSQSLNTLYTWIYTFHMPVFIFLAGFFAKGAGSLAYITKLAKKLLVPYIIFQVIYTGYYLAIGKQNWLADSIFYPHWSLWFLVSLFCWHILLIFYKKLPPSLSVVIAVQVGLIVGYFGQVGHTFSLSRTFVFFPFFLLGYWITVEQVKVLKHVRVKIASLVFMAIMAVGIYYAPDINSGWLLASKSYGQLGLPEYGGIARFFVYVTSALMGMSILAWIPQRELIITSYGSRTLYVYLLHGFFIQFFRQYDLLSVDGIIDLLGIGLLSCLLVFLLASKPIRIVWQPLIEGRVTILRRLWKQLNPRQT